VAEVGADEDEDAARRGDVTGRAMGTKSRFLTTMLEAVEAGVDVADAEEEEEVE
jgi:hypothetical protein